MITDSRADISVEVRTIIANTLGVPVENIQESSAITELSQDSIQLFELLLAFERAYTTEVSYEDVAKLNTVNDIIAYVHSVRSIH